MGEKITLGAAIKRHLILPGDKIVEQVKQLTGDDKMWLAERFRIEYGYVIDSYPKAII